MIALGRSAGQNIISFVISIVNNSTFYHQKHPLYFPFARYLARPTKVANINPHCNQ